MISEMLLDVVFANFSSAFFSLSFMRSEMKFCNYSVSFLFGCFRFLGKKIPVV